MRIEHDIPDAQKLCACGYQLSRIGETTNEQFDLVPARARVFAHPAAVTVDQLNAGVCEAIAAALEPATPIDSSEAQ